MVLIWYVDNTHFYWKKERVLTLLGYRGSMIHVD